MRIYAITIKPLSPFGTPLKGDTIFGQFCWQAAENQAVLSSGLDYWISCYSERPFAVFSSAWPKINTANETIYAIRRPELPQSLLGDSELDVDCAKRLKGRKEKKARKWLLIGEDLQIRLTWEFMENDQEIYERIVATLPEVSQKRLRLTPVHHRRPVSSAEQQHNSINRLTMTTGKGEFAPYVTDNIYYMPGMELVIFAGLDEDACGIEELKNAFTRMGQWGFGRDASTGLGRFSVEGVKEIVPPVVEQADACLVLGPCVPEPEHYKAMYFNPFTRFGRHGAQMLHTGKPFKNPVVMADEGAVFVPHAGSFPDKPYIGRSVQNISKAQPEAVCQGYSLYLPMQMPVLNQGENYGV
ncbi:MAG: hypothetical protein KJ900_17485 [Proteobacteria bacterium]|nr:hypothetical protein [Desulfocapsa sp.]MBU3945341.1 hypothetical protein [Pseudomonadota bacterium]MCG2743107.1 hypothetical protein [Desulfobacteraceae bacterium]MBU4029595.1 hypothetical protein [Pseudomonadota bacterium]MBU4044657.1 hypothetical protein [Pseudomonadota bacterium]